MKSSKGKKIDIEALYERARAADPDPPPEADIADLNRRLAEALDRHLGQTNHGTGTPPAPSTAGAERPPYFRG